ncbi:hypothetical protein R1sor_016585 [Riccia sorocarpa]|uniref:Sperm-associated antigen 16 protein n=1 Tax=Riccia sorocarpa TaxID=122646 RepID=A0ABD3HHE4_9MARC
MEFPDYNDSTVDNLFEDAATLDSSIGDYNLEEIEMDSETEAEDDTASEDLDATMKSIQKLTFLMGKNKGIAAGVTTKVKTYGEVMDDFVRNFLIQNGCVKTVECFETEWHDLKEKGRLLDCQLHEPPDEYTRSLEVQSVLSKVQEQLKQSNLLAQYRQDMTEKFRKERNVHRMHHNRIAQEKNKLINDMKLLRKHYAKYEPVIRTLKRKFEVVTRQKATIMLERDRLKDMIEKAGFNKQSEPEPPLQEKKPEPVMMYMGKPDPLVIVRPDRRTIIDATPKPSNVQKYTLRRTFKGHSMSISNVVVHPKKPVVVTASDDATWRMWGLPAGDLIMTGDGHKDWVSGLSFHPGGMQLASSSGDCTVKIWSFEKARCTHTFSDHTQAVWAVAYHDSGEVLASASLDHTARIWDLERMKCRGTLRGHVDSVNSVMWQSYSSILCTSSSDKTVSLWDARNALCVQTFYGHEASCNHATFSPRGNLVASVDADGVLKIWDVRQVMERHNLNVGPDSANKVCFDPSGTMIAIASNDGHVKCFQQLEMELVPVNDLTGHEGAVQALIFDPLGKFLISGGSDGTFRCWA